MTDTATANERVCLPMQIPDGIRMVKVAGIAEAKRVARDSAVSFAAEVNFGAQSFVQAKTGKRSCLALDHHGPELSGRPAVAIQAYGDTETSYWRWIPKQMEELGVENATIIVAGQPDEDACAAIAIALGVVPHWSFPDIFPEASDWAKTNYGRNVGHAIQLIGRVDCDPNQAFALLDTVVGRQILTFRQFSFRADDILAWWGGVERMRTILSTAPSSVTESAASKFEAELERVAALGKHRFGKHVVAVDLSEFGNNSLYYRKLLEEVEILVAFIGNALGEGQVTLASRDMTTAVKLLGPRGQLDLYPHLRAWGNAGGREVLGGLDRSMSFTMEDAKAAAEAIASFIAEQKRAAK